MSRDDLPTGTVTFLFTDVEGSTPRLRELGEAAYAAAVAEHRRVIRSACRRHGGVEVDTQGDAFFFAFASAAGAIAAAAELTVELAHGLLQSRVGLHTGEALVTAEGYVGNDVHVAAGVAAAAHGGQVALTKATAALVDDGLTSLGEHRFAGLPEPVALYQLGDARFPPLRSISNTNLPRPASSFVGRREDLEALHSYVEAGARLVTLTGAGGAGKSRVAIELAVALLPNFDAGVFWVALASLRDPTLVTDTIAQTLGAKTTLEEHIGGRRMCLVLDNFEQVVDAAPAVARLLEACPNLAVIVTSRERLRISGELEHEIRPLRDADAVTLFCARSRLEPALEVAELCRRLDNLPLAIELAAARTKALSPSQILDRLGQRLDLLKGGREADPRQQTLRATLEWSHGLLSDHERQLFRRLSVFADGCTLDAAEDVCAADVDTIQSLVEKSLLRVSGERYWMLETIRTYASEQLSAEEGDAVRRRHRRYVVALAEAAAAQLHSRDEAPVSARLAPEYANVRAAVEDGLAAGEPDDVGRIIGALYAFLISHGHLAEVHEWAAAALAARERLTDRGLAELLVGAGEIARFAGDLPRAVELKEELEPMDVDVYRPNWKAATLADLCEIALDEGDLPRARAYAEQCAVAGGGARAALCLGELALRHGDLVAAEAHGLEALEGYEEGALNHACALELLAETARRSGDLVRARGRFHDGLRSFAAIADPGGIADCLDGLARVAATNGHPDRAGRLAGAAERLRVSRGRRPIRADIAPVDAPDTAREEGRRMTVEEAVEYALELSQPAGRPSAPTPSFSAATARQPARRADARRAAPDGATRSWSGTPASMAPRFRPHRSARAAPSASRRRR